MNMKERLLDELRASPRSKDELLALFDDQAQQRGAASLLAYLMRSDQVAINGGGLYQLTGREPKKLTRRAQQSPDDAQPDEVPADSREPELEWALWHDGDLLLRRGDTTLVLTQEERDRLLEWLPRVAA